LEVRSAFAMLDGRRPVNGPDYQGAVCSAEPDVNIGPDTAFGGKGRERPCKAGNGRSFPSGYEQGKKVLSLGERLG
jgi:hypothetical protein